MDFYTKPLLSLGFSITSASEKLQRVSINEIVNLITGEKTSSLKQEVSRLQKLKIIDKMTYRNLKTRLPYLVGGLFKDDYRRADNIEAIHFLILDIDHLIDFDGNIPETIKTDETVLLAFISPSGEGVKVLFRLETPILVKDGFQNAYRDFAEQFGIKTGLTGFIDLKTSDVSRACFLSYDENVYFNPLSIPVQLQIMQPLVDNVPFVQEEGNQSDSDPINQTAYKAILKEINPHISNRPKKEVVLPSQLVLLEPEIEKLCTNAALVLVGQQAIQHGIKIIAKQGYRMAEVNIFYGKRGYSVIISPKTGTDKTLNETLHRLLYDFLFPDATEEKLPF
jgi:hypothetical protein